MDDRENAEVTVSERTPGLPLVRRIEDDGRTVPVHELLAARQPEGQSGLRIVQHAAYELLDGRDRRTPDEPARHERERLSCVGLREE